MLRDRWFHIFCLSINKSAHRSALAGSAAGRHRMMNECAQIVLRVQPMSTEDCRTTVIEALSRLEGVKTVSVDLTSGVVRVDGAVGDRELVAAVESVGRRALVVTHTRGIGQSRGQTPIAGQSSGWLKMQLFMKLMRRQVDCCGD
eukprot:scaffold19192_cov67-Phaeocystis_antarctica.AAC.4